MAVTFLVMWPLIVFSGRDVFDFFDMSAFFDAAYRISQSQIPYKDFFYNSGPVHIWLYSLFIQFAGPNQFAPLLYIYALTVIAFVGLFLISLRYVEFWLAFLLATMGSVLFYGPIRHPFYDLSAWAFLYLAVAILVWLDKFSSQRVQYLLQSLLIVSLGFSVLCKTNIGLLGAAVVVFSFLISRRRDGAFWRQVGVASFASGTVIFLCYYISGISLGDFFNQTLIQYRVVNRLSRMYKLRDILFESDVAWAGYVTILTFAAAAILPVKKRLKSSNLVLLLGIWGVGIFGAWTGSLSVDSMLAGVAILIVLGICFIVDRSLGPVWRWRLLAVLVCGLAGTVGEDIYYRVRQPSVWLFRPSNLTSTYEMTLSQFEGWRCNPRFCIGMEDTVKFLRKAEIRPQQLLVYPDATIIYALLGVEPFKGAPFIFHLNDFPPPGELTRKFAATVMENSPDWLVLHYPFENSEIVGVIEGLQSLGLREFVSNSYQMIEMFGDYVVLHKKSRIADNGRSGP